MKFEVLGKIKGKARPRLGKYNTYTPTDTINYENLVKISYLNARGINFYDKPIKMKIEAIFEPAKSISKKKRNELMMIQAVTKKPDFDNIGKIVADALNKIAYNDDSQICKFEIIKRYGEQEKLIIEVEEYENTKDSNQR